MTVEEVKCRMCAQTRLFDKVIIFLTQQCPAADQTNWMMRVQQLKSEMDVEQQGRVGDIRNLLGLQTNTPRPKEKNEDATTRRPIKVGSESRGSNLRLTKRETDAAQKTSRKTQVTSQDAQGLTRDRDFHWIAVEEEVLRCEICGKTKILDKATVMFQQRCATAKQEGWCEKIFDKLNRESNDGESDQEEARVSLNLFDLLEPTEQRKQ